MAVAKKKPAAEVVAPAVEAEVVAPAAEVSLFETALAAARTSDPKFAYQENEEAGQVFLKRLLHTLSEVTEEVWNALPEAVQLWYNTSGEQIEKGEEIAAIDGFVEAVKPVKRTGAQALAEKARSKPEAAKPAKAAPAAKAEKAPAAPKAEGIVSKIKRVILSSPDILTLKSADALALCTNAGLADIKPATLAVVLTDTQGTVRVAKEIGLIK